MLEGPAAHPSIRQECISHCSRSALSVCPWECFSHLNGILLVCRCFVCRKTGRDTLDFIMDFPPEYPFKPPFIRALRPRFAFHTGHITIGGSVCMELLTTSGWSAANSVESILIQIRTEITAGGGFSVLILCPTIYPSLHALCHLVKGSSGEGFSDCHGCRVRFLLRRKAARRSCPADSGLMLAACSHLLSRRLCRKD